MAAATERQPTAATAAVAAPSASATALPVTSRQGHHHAGERGTAHYAFLQRVNAEIAQSRGHDRTLQLIEILEAAEAEPADDDSWRAAAPRFELDLRTVLALPTTPLTTTHSTFPGDSTSSSSPPPPTSTANALAKWWIQSRLRQLASSAAAGITATSTVAFFGLEAGKWAISSGMVQSYFASSAVKKLCDTALALPRSVIDPAIRLLRPVLGFASRHHVLELAALGTLGWLFVDSHRRYTETVRQHAAVHAAVAAARAQAEHDHVGGDDPMFFAPTHAMRENEEERRAAHRRLTTAGGAPPPRQPATAVMSPELQRALWMHHATTAVVGAAFCAVAFCYVWKTIVLARKDVAAIDSNGTLAVRPSQVRLPNAAQEHLAVVFREPIDSVASERTVTITTVNNTDIVEGSRLPAASSRAASGWRGDELQLGSGSLAVVKGCHGVGLPKDTWRTALYIYDGARCGYVKLGPDGAAVNISRLLPELSLSGDKCADLTSVAASSV